LACKPCSTRGQSRCRYYKTFFLLCHLQLGRITLKDCPARASLMCTNKARACPSGVTYMSLTHNY
jgi:hypothetical protein